MALDKYNLRLQRVPSIREEEFKNSVPEEGELFQKNHKQYIVVGNGSKKNGIVLASKDQVEYVIKHVEVHDNYKGIELE